MPSSESRKDWIVREARKHAPGERAAFLDGSCAGDLALRQRIDAKLAARLVARLPLSCHPDSLNNSWPSMHAKETGQRNLATIIPQSGTDTVGYSALSRWVLLRSNDLLPGNVRP